MTELERKDFIMRRVTEHYNEACSLGYEVVGVWLQGSQNYNLDIYEKEYKSDIDTKCIILPTLQNIVNGSMPYSYTHIRANNEHIDIKDIRLMVEMFKKQNISYLEILFTDFFVINPKYQDLVDELKLHAEEIARLDVNQALRCIAGMSLEKYKELEHPFPSVIDKIEKFGYDPKQLHHILRLVDFTKKYIAGKSYKECLIPDDIKYLVEVKKGLYLLDDARTIASKNDLFIKQMRDENMVEPAPINYEVIEELKELKFKFIKRFLKEEIMKGD